MGVTMRLDEDDMRQLLLGGLLPDREGDVDAPGEDAARRGQLALHNAVTRFLGAALPYPSTEPDGVVLTPRLMPGDGTLVHASVPLDDLQGDAFRQMVVRAIATLPPALTDS